MANGMHASFSTPRVRNGEPQPAPPPAPAEPASTKRDLTSWWKQFSKRGNPKREEEKEPVTQGIFGVPLDKSITYANVAISLFNEGGESYIYGYVPIVVAKCGVFLKEKATDIEGIFRLAGSEKRIKELKHQFDTPDRFGKGLDWTGYTVHDAANILRRYFNQLPEPIIPLNFYEAFRQPLRNHQGEAVGHIDGQAPSIGGFDMNYAIGVYQRLIKDLPPLNRQLLLYILDLLAVFAAKADINKMTTSNLAAIFQPGILSHPHHDMSPQEYRLSQDVLIFLIENQDHFLIGMEGTAVDEGTVKQIESGPSTPQAKTPTTPGRGKNQIGRSASSASSAGADSIRKYGNIRRNVSVSSRNSKHSAVMPSPVTPIFSTPTGSGVHRSNTVPSNKSPAIPAARFSREKQSDPPTPSSELTTTAQAQVAAPSPAPAPAPNSVQTAAQVPAPAPAVSTQVSPPVTESVEVAAPMPAPVQPGPPEVVSPSSSEDTTPLAAPLSVNSTSGLISTPPAPPQAQHPRDRTTSRDRSEFKEGSFSADPTTPALDQMTGASRTFTQIFSRVSPQSEEKRDRNKPNKLQKKNRIGGSTTASAHSSTHSLSGHGVGLDSPPSPLPSALSHGFAPSSSREGFHGAGNDSTPSRISGATLKPSMSPSASFRSHSTATEYSEAEVGDEPQDYLEPGEKKEKRRWGRHKREESRTTPTASETNFGSIAGAEKSMSSISSAGRGRRSLQVDSTQGSDTSSLPFITGESGNGKEGEKKGPINWFKEKFHDRKEREAEKNRAKSPPGSMVDLTGSVQSLSRPTEGLSTKRKSMDVPRAPNSEELADITSTTAPPTQTSALASGAMSAPIQNIAQQAHPPNTANANL